jgi:hypothetical protein
MPMPSKGCAADVPSDVCCDTWWLIGERIRTVAFHGVCACIDPTCVDREFASYSTDGDIHSILGESLAMTFLGAEVASGQTGRTGNVRPTPMTRLSFLLELRENGWPLPAHTHAATETIVQADWQMLHALSKHSRGHAEKMWRAVANAASTTRLADRMFSPSLHPFIMERGIGIGRITPLPEFGPQCGYRLPITVDMQLL